MFFPVPNNFNNITGKEVWINGAKIDSAQATIGLGQFVIRYDLSRLPKDQDTLAIVLKDTSTNQFSDEQIVQVGAFSKLTITSIDTGKGGDSNFTFNIKGNTNALFGDIYKIKININNIDYTRDGTRELIKNGSGVVQKDSNGDDKYETKNKIEFRKTGAGIEFDFFYSQLKDGENVIYIKNETSGRESNKVSFMKKNSAEANYNYLTGSSITEANKKEVLTFEAGKDIEKKMNPVTMGSIDRNISL